MYAEWAKRRAKKSVLKVQSGAKCEMGEEDDQEAPHFSKVTRSKPELFPLFGKARCLEVELLANESLFLPAGWFHEVRVFADFWDDDTE